MAIFLFAGKLAGQGQNLTTVYKYFIEFSRTFFYSNGRHEIAMNRLFEQDPQFPFFGSREEQAAFCSAKNAASDDKTSGAAQKPEWLSKSLLESWLSRAHWCLHADKSGRLSVSQRLTAWPQHSSFVVLCSIELVLR